MKKISVFIDASNLFHCQLKNGWMLDFIKLKNYLETKGEIVGLYYFTPTPEYIETEKVKRFRNFKNFLIANGYTVIDKEVKLIPDIDDTGNKIFVRKGNLDGEIVLYMLTTYEDYDELIFIGGDSDFESVIDYLIKHKKLVRCISNSRNTSLEIKNISHYFENLSELKEILFKENVHKLKRPEQENLA